MILLLSCKSVRSKVTLTEGLWGRRPCCPVWWLLTHARCERAGVAACAASGSKGAHVRLVMSGVTRQPFQNTAVNKVKVSCFAGRRFVFMSWTVHGWSNFSKQTSHLCVCGSFFVFGLKKNSQMRFSDHYVLKQNYILVVFFSLFFIEEKRFLLDDLRFLNALSEGSTGPSPFKDWHIAVTTRSKTVLWVLYL